jgi:hypothetical protein
MARRAKQNYINNYDFLQAIIVYKAECREADEAGVERPIMPKYLGECIYKIATRLATKPNFSNYPFKEDMVGDGIENALTYFHNFDETKYSNPFAYYTQIIWFAFLRRIAKEKKLLYTKYQAMINSNMMNMTSALQEHDKTAYADFIKQSEGSADYMEEFIRSYEETLMKNKAPKEVKTQYDEGTMHQSAHDAMKPKRNDDADVETDNISEERTVT